MEYLERIIKPSFEIINNLTNEKQYEFIFKGHHLNGREFYVSKNENRFNFETTSEIIKGVQTHKELEFHREDEYELKNESGSIYIKGKDIFLNNLTYSESFQSKILSGSIYSYSNIKSADKKNDLYRRFILPLESDKIGFTDFQRKGIKTESSYSFYIPISIDKHDFYLYERKVNESNYLIIDSSYSLQTHDFQKICFNILLALAFLKGNLFHNECFILGFDTHIMDLPLETNYFSMRATLITNQPTFTTNAYSIYSDLIESDNNQAVKQELKDKYYDDIYDFPYQQFSKLAEMLYKEDKIQRAVLLFIYGHSASMEMRLPNYFVAIEALTGYIVSSRKEKKENLNPIKDTKIANEIQSKIVELLNSFKSEKDLSDVDFNIDILTKKVNTLNSPPNADKLAESFTLLDYQLSDEQRSILKERNSFLHGSFVKYVDNDIAFREALYICLRVHFLISVLVMKIIGFNGKIINYCSLWEHITEKKVNEDRMIKI